MAVGAKIAKTADRKKGYGHQQEYGLSQVRQDYAHCETNEGSRARCSGRNLYFLFGLRVLRKTLALQDFCFSRRKGDRLPFSGFCYC